MGRRRGVTWVVVIGLGLAISLTAPTFANSPPLALWTPEVLQRIHDHTTLNLSIIPQVGFFDVFFDSEIKEAKWADSASAYAVHKGGDGPGLMHPLSAAYFPAMALR
jgi:hypothetical protein